MLQHVEKGWPNARNNVVWCCTNMLDPFGQGVRLTTSPHSLFRKTQRNAPFPVCRGHGVRSRTWPSYPRTRRQDWSRNAEDPVSGNMVVNSSECRLHAVPFFPLSNWETGASEMRDRARDWSEQGRRPRGEWGRGKRLFFVLPPHSPCGFASRSLQSLTYCGREKKGTACSLQWVLILNPFTPKLKTKISFFYTLYKWGSENG